MGYTKGIQWTDELVKEKERKASKKEQYTKK